MQNVITTPLLKTLARLNYNIRSLARASSKENDDSIAQLSDTAAGLLLDISTNRPISRKYITDLLSHLKTFSNHADGLLDYFNAEMDNAIAAQQKTLSTS